MGSRREEDRNERIIRGLMKLPPNRRCINCNSLGPQYVCTNFWTFVCMTCSGIHREFTHRVKSVSMSKFTSQEVEALQNGGNQRAREIYLKDWDLQKQRLPANSNVDKVREFIKSVYVDKRYAGGKSADKPPRDLQRLGSQEDDTRRASSYHSYSQSPPYDFQYEDRRYGKQAAVLTRKPGSERGLFAGKMSSFISSPTRLSDRSLEDRFANEGSVSRFSDYSVSSGGDPIRSGVESPNFQKDAVFSISSPPVQSSRNIVGEDLFSEAHFRRDANGIPPRQRTASLGSIGSFDSNSMSQKSYNSGNLADTFSEPEHTAQAYQDNMSVFPQASTSVGHSGLNLSGAPFFPESGTSPAPPIDLFELKATSQSTSVDLFQGSSNSDSSVNLNQSSLTSVQSSADLFADTSQQQPATKKEENPVESHKDEGWATFDTNFPVAAPGTTDFSFVSPSTKPSSMSSTMNDQHSSLNMSQWPGFQDPTVQSSSSVSDPWHQNFPAVKAAATTADAQTWNAFDDPPVNDVKLVNEPNTEPYLPLSPANQYLGQRFLEDSGGIHSATPYGGFPCSNGLSDVAMGLSYASSVHPPMKEESLPHQSDNRSTNPFDLPYDDSVLEHDKIFMDMNSLHAALPNVHMPSTFIDGVGQPWFSEDPATAYLPTGSQGALAYMAGQTPNPQLTNVQAQGPVASVGGNPFA